MDQRHYILEGHETKPASLMEWAMWLEANNLKRHVKDERVGDVRVSTVFLGLDHRWGDGPPQLFETMVFGGPLDQEQDHYSTWDEAEKGHAATVERVKASTLQTDSSPPPGKEGKPEEEWYDDEVLCEVCGENFGEHSGLSCPHPHRSTFRPMNTK